MAEQLDGPTPRKGRKTRNTVTDAKTEDFPNKVTEKQYVDVSFVCQKCYQPLTVDKSLTASVLEGQLEQMKQRKDCVKEMKSSPECLSSQGTQEDSETKRKQWAMTMEQSLREEEIDASSLDLSTVLISINDPQDRERVTRQLQLAEQYFNAVSSQSSVDHPLCNECACDILHSIEDHIVFSEESRFRYEECLRKWTEEFEEEGGDAMEKALEDEVEQLKLEEMQLKQKLADVEQKRRAVKDEVKEAQMVLAELREEDNELHRQYNIHQADMLDLQDEVRSTEYQTSYATEQLKKLTRTNILSLSFYIWHQGLFGTINGLRLGRLITVPVEWGEINAAWGQCALLLCCLARYANLEFQKYRVIPCGSQSVVEQQPEKAGRSPVPLPLYTSGGYRFMLDSKFDRAMIGYLDCLNQLKGYIEESSGGYKLPYRIDKDRLVDDDQNKAYLIRMQGNSPEHWTKALKYMLTNLQWAIGWRQVMTLK